MLDKHATVYDVGLFRQIVNSTQNYRSRGGQKAFFVILVKLSVAVPSARRQAAQSVGELARQTAQVIEGAHPSVIRSDKNVLVLARATSDIGLIGVYKPARHLRGRRLSRSLLTIQNQDRKGARVHPERRNEPRGV